MTEYEYAQLFVDFLAAANTVFANYMTLVFATLTASYFLAARLTRLLAGLLLALYSLWSVNLISGVYGAFSDFCQLGLAIHEIGQRPGSELGWLGPVAAGDSIGYMKVMPDIMLFMCGAVYLLSLFFFFIARRHGYGLGRSIENRIAAEPGDED